MATTKLSSSSATTLFRRRSVLRLFNSHTSPASSPYPLPSSSSLTHDVLSNADFSSSFAALPPDLASTSTSTNNTYQKFYSVPCSAFSYSSFSANSLGPQGAFPRPSSSSVTFERPFSISSDMLFRLASRRSDVPSATVMGSVGRSFLSSSTPGAGNSPENGKPPPPLPPPPPPPHWANPRETENPDPVTLQEQWRYATRTYSKWYAHAWGTAIVAGLSFYAIGWFVKGENPLSFAIPEGKEEQK